ncbi:hypothetical protein [Streptomyces sp. NBC_00207]|uniref:hypothetical protein n=1 Tax=unclassified Streptomyces TaxID=2593676 RepID=UPI0028854E41|nr:hypothetical protein [Streptomyces sp. DSM 41633]
MKYAGQGQPDHAQESLVPLMPGPEYVEQDPRLFACCDCGQGVHAPARAGNGKIVMRGSKRPRGWRQCGHCARNPDPLHDLLTARCRPLAAALAIESGLTLAQVHARPYWDSGTAKAPTLPTDPPQAARWAHIPTDHLDQIALACADIVHGRIAAATGTPLHELLVAL